jgi:succinyl-CoA synthetase beta subunit
MITAPVAEVMVSLRRDDQFGCILTMASGGVMVELLKDAVTVIMPTDAAGLDEAIDQLAVAQLIAGYRGKAAGNRKALNEAIMTLTHIMANDANIRMIEINPIMITPDEAIAADAVIHIRA